MSIEEKRDRYVKLCMAMQSGVAFSPTTDQSPKHLRVGVNAAMSDHGSLVKLLIDKKIITEDEYFDALIAGMDREVKSYEERLSERTGKIVKLGPAGFGGQPE
jgi:hypothetical protein